MKAAKIIALSLIALFAFCAVTNHAVAQFRLPFGKKSAADQKNSIHLSEKDGPWLIMCASFVGEEGRVQAMRLAQDLRDNHKLPAFVYGHKFDFNEKTQGVTWGWKVNTNGGADTHKRIRATTAGKSNVEEIAVLVGNFSSVEDARAQRTLEAIKLLNPRSLANYDPAKAIDDDSIAASRAWRDLSIQKDPNKRGKGPLKAAFLLPNPLLPDEYFAARKIDDFVLKLNKGNKYSLLDNKGKYSVKVATFSGDTTLEIDEMKQMKARDSWMQKNRKTITDSKLANALKKAEILVKYLRSKRIEAYVFHDRHESYVCVGSFDWIVETDVNGEKKNNPAVVDTILKFKGSSVRLPDKPGAITTYKLPQKFVQAGIACDVQPIPVLVRKNESMLKANRLFGFNRK